MGLFAIVKFVFAGVNIAQCATFLNEGEKMLIFGQLEGGSEIAIWGQLRETRNLSVLYSNYVLTVFGGYCLINLAGRCFSM